MSVCKFSARQFFGTTGLKIKGIPPMRSFLSGVVVASALAFHPAAAQDRSDCDPGEQELKFSLVTAVQGHPKGEAALAFAGELNRKFNGRYCVVVYGNAELYDDNDTLYDAMLAGEITFAAPSLDKLDRFTNTMNLFSLPFLFDGPLHAQEFLDSDAAAGITNDFEDDGFYAFGFWSNGMRQMSATVPLRRPSDAAGLKFRVSNGSALTAAIFQAMGAEAIELPFSQVFDALSSGQVQGQENTWSNIETRRFYTVQNSVTETNHTYLGYLTLTTTGFLDSLSPEDRQTVIDTMRLVTHERNRFAFELNQISRQNIIDDGGIILQLTPEELQEFRDAFRPVFERYAPEVGLDLVQKAVEINANARPYD